MQSSNYSQRNQIKYGSKKTENVFQKIRLKNKINCFFKNGAGFVNEGHRILKVLTPGIDRKRKLGSLAFIQWYGLKQNSLQTNAMAAIPKRFMYLTMNKERRQRITLQ